MPFGATSNTVNGEPTTCDPVLSVPLYTLYTKSIGPVPCAIDNIFIVKDSLAQIVVEPVPASAGSAFIPSTVIAT